MEISVGKARRVLQESLKSARSLHSTDLGDISAQTRSEILSEYGFVSGHSAELADFKFGGAYQQLLCSLCACANFDRTLAQRWISPGLKQIDETADFVGHD